jgi:hypothetical protein
VKKSDIINHIKDCLFEKGVAEFEIAGNCMSPVLKNLQKIKVHPVCLPYKDGKRYVFFRENQLFIHRLVRVKNGKALFIGDRSKNEEIINTDMIIGEPVVTMNLITQKLIGFINRIILVYLGKYPLLRIFRVYIITFFLKVECFQNERVIRKTRS